MRGRDARERHTAAVDRRREGDEAVGPGHLAAGVTREPTAVANPTAQGDFCNIDGVLVKGDGKVTGLDRGGNTLNVELVKDHYQTTCVGIEIAPQLLSEVAFTAASSPMGCDVRCVVKADGCDSHEYVDVFAAPASGVWVWLGRQDTTKVLADYALPVSITMQPVTKIAVCRDDGSKDREDEIVDFIGPHCR